MSALPSPLTSPMATGMVNFLWVPVCFGGEVPALWLGAWTCLNEANVDQVAWGRSLGTSWIESLPICRQLPMPPVKASVANQTQCWPVRMLVDAPETQVVSNQIIEIAGTCYI